MTTRNILSRTINIPVSLVLLVILSPILILIAIAIKITSDGPAIHWSHRIGKNNKSFLMPKFRSMLTSTPQLATDLLPSSEQFITPVGAFLRRTSLDELPQIWSILTGSMNFVGPRPALFNQNDLINKRTQLNVHSLKPGLTGWAQINGRDEISLEQKVQYDLEYLRQQSLIFDVRILCLTFIKVVYRDNIRH